MKAPTHCCVMVKSYSNEDVETVLSVPPSRCEIGRDTVYAYLAGHADIYLNLRTTLSRRVLERDLL